MATHVFLTNSFELPQTWSWSGFSRLIPPSGDEILCRKRKKKEKRNKKQKNIRIEKSRSRSFYHLVDQWKVTWRKLKNYSVNPFADPSWPSQSPSPSSDIGAVPAVRIAHIEFYGIASGDRVRNAGGIWWHWTIGAIPVEFAGIIPKYTRIGTFRSGASCASNCRLSYRKFSVNKPMLNAFNQQILYMYRE